LKKIAPKSFGRYFLEKNAPNAKKYHPNGEISPNLVTLTPCLPEMFDNRMFFPRQEQGDQIRQIFANWVIIYFGQYFESYRS
jgi:hypothetical protein